VIVVIMRFLFFWTDGSTKRVLTLAERAKLAAGRTQGRVG
jgi:hypothetical protein